MSIFSCSRFATLPAICAILVGCGSDQLINSIPSRPDALWTIDLNTAALTMAIGETFQLVATPRTYAGDSIPNLIKTYRSGDEKRVRVDTNGVVTAVDITFAFSPVPLYAVINSPRDSMTIEDTVFVMVTSTPQTIQTFTMEPSAGDSTRHAAGIPGRSVDARVLDPDGNSITDLNIAYWTSNPRVAATFGSYMQGVDTGNVMIYASTTAYGVTYTDSIQYRITYPIAGYFNIYPRYFSFPDSDPILSGPEVRVASGGVVTWQSQSKYDVDIVFDDPSTALDPDDPDSGESGGNIPHVQGFIDGDNPGTSARRKFIKVGRHPFHSTKYPHIRGHVEVVE